MAWCLAAVQPHRHACSADGRWSGSTSGAGRPSGADGGNGPPMENGPSQRSERKRAGKRFASVGNVLALVVASLLSSAPAPAQDLYPLAVGAQWVYVQQVFDSRMGPRAIAQERIVRKVTRKVRLPIAGRPPAFEIVTHGNLTRLPRWAQRSIEYAVVADDAVRIYSIEGVQHVPVLERALPRVTPGGGLFIVNGGPVQTVARAQVMLQPYRGPGVTLERRGCNTPTCEVSDVTLAPGVGPVAFAWSGGVGLSPTQSVRAELVELRWAKKHPRSP
jgi:hypothetical protein